MYLILCFIIVITYNRKKEQKISISYIILVSILFVIYNAFCTHLSTRIGGDRSNYLYEFLGYRSTSIGLTYIFNLVKIFTNDIRYVYYLTTFICSYITFYCLFRDKNSNVYSLTFLLCTDFIFFTFVALKQCYVCAIMCLIYYIIFNYNKRHKYLIVSLLVYIACLFHSTGFILILIVIIFYLYKNKKINPVYIIMLFAIFLLFFSNIIALLSRILYIYMPSLSDKIYEYFYSPGVYTDSKLIFLKGLPFYIVSILGIVKYKKYRKIDNYDKLLILCSIGSIAYFISIISYWMYRITAIFYLPLSLLFGIIINNEKKGKNKLVYFLLCVLLNLIILIRWLYIVCMSGGF